MGFKDWLRKTEPEEEQVNNEQLYSQIVDYLRGQIPTIGECTDEGETIQTIQKWHYFKVQNNLDEANFSVMVLKHGFEVDKPILRASFGLLHAGRHRELVNVIADQYRFEQDGSNYQTPHQFNRYESFSIKCSSVDDACRVLSATRDYFRVASQEGLREFENERRQEIKQLENTLNDARIRFYQKLEDCIKCE